jgi:hypothetical protein
MSAVIADENPQTYRQVWHAVIQQSIREALSFDDAAIRWLLCQPDQDFLKVCELAEQNSHYLRTRIATWLLASATALASGKAGTIQNGHFTWITAYTGQARLAQRFLSSEPAVAARLYAPRFDPGLSDKIIRLGLSALSV